MKIKINNKEYESAKIRYYNNLINSLKIILADNSQLKHFKYHGIIHKNDHGILVCGIDSKGVRPFEKFYSIRDIHHYFNKHLQKIHQSGERRLFGN